MYLSRTFYGNLKEFWTLRGLIEISRSGTIEDPERAERERLLRESLLDQLNRAAEQALNDRAAPCRPDFAQMIAVPLALGADPFNCRFILRYLGRHLLPLESALSALLDRLNADQWAMVFEGAELRDYQAYLERETTSSWVLVSAIVGAMKSARNRDPRDAAAVAALDSVIALGARLFPRVLTDGCSVPQEVFDQIVRAALEAEDFGEHVSTWRNALIGWAIAAPETGARIDSEVFEVLLAQVMDASAARTIIGSLTPAALAKLSGRSPRLVRHLIQHQPGQVAQTVARAWREAMLPGLPVGVTSVLTLGYAQLSGPLSAEIAYECARISHAERADPDVPVEVAALLERSLPCVTESEADPIIQRRARVWAYLLKYVDYGERRGDHTMERRGCEAIITQHALEFPEDWAAMVPMLLTRGAALQELAESITLLTASAVAVRDALQACVSGDEQALRDRARGMLATIEGVEMADRELSGRVLSRLARCVDGRPAFPHPLDIRSSTWICSLPAEATFRARVEAAVSGFCAQLKDQLGALEEVLTERLASSIKSALENAVVTLSAVGGSRSTKGAFIKVEDRQTTKAEETEHGADLAFLLTVSVPGAFLYQSAELVQSKRPAREHGARTPFIDAWDIDVPQLKDISNVSQTAAYWLFGREGEVLVVPARLLFGLIAGSNRQEQGSARVYYADVRSMSIPLHQFLVDLFIGGWLGSSTERALSVARGEDPYLKPRRILEVTIKFDTLDAARQ